jgi:hypothetical protein
MRGAVRLTAGVTVALSMRPDGDGAWVGSAVVDSLNLAHPVPYTRCVALSSRECFATLAQWADEQLRQLVDVDGAP